MKLTIIGTGLLSVFILTICIVMSLGKDNTENEKLAEVVEVAIYQSLQEALENKSDPGEEFKENIDVLMTEDSYSVTILESDYAKGILSVSVEISYKNMGKNRTTEVKRTVIYERDEGTV